MWQSEVRLFKLESVAKGVDWEPLLGAPARKTNYKSLKGLVGERGFEPPTPWSRNKGNQPSS
jgi:hypothetical protein